MEKDNHEADSKITEKGEAMTRVKLFIIAGIVGMQMGCGPSLRRTYQSDTAFATCFSSDYDPAVDPGEKDACWRSWLEGYVYNQPPDKISYAKLRLTELEQGVSIPGPPGPPGRFDQRPRLPEAKAGPDVAPADGCRTSCRSASASCEAVCDSAGGEVQKCLDACAAGAAACLKFCENDGGAQGAAENSGG